MKAGAVTLHIAFTAERGYACILAKAADGREVVRHVETLHADYPAYVQLPEATAKQKALPSAAWRTLWLAALYAAPQDADAVVFYTDDEDLVQTVQRFRQSSVERTGSGRFRRAYTKVPGLDKSHPAYAYIRSVVPMLNEFWPNRWRIVQVSRDRLQETVGLAPERGYP